MMKVKLHLFKDSRENTFRTSGPNPLPLKLLGFVIVGILIFVVSSKSDAAFSFRPVVNQLPSVEILTDSANLMVEVGDTLEIPFEATDANEDELVIFFQNGEGLPKGATFDRYLNKVTWTPTADQVGQHYFTVSAFDGQHSGIDDVVIDVVNPNGHLPHLKLEKLIQRAEFKPNDRRLVLYLTPAIVENIGSKKITDLKVSVVCDDPDVRNTSSGERITIGDIASGASSAVVDGRFRLDFPVSKHRSSVEVSFRFAGYYSFLGMRVVYGQTITLNVGIGSEEDDFGGYNIGTPATLYPGSNGKLELFGTGFGSHPENPWSGNGLIPIEFEVGAMSSKSYIAGSGMLDDDGTQDLVIIDPLGDLIIVTWDTDSNASDHWGYANQHQMKVDRIKNVGVSSSIIGIGDYNRDSYDDLYLYSRLTNEVVVFDYVPGADGGHLEVLDRVNTSDDYEYIGLVEFRGDSKHEIIWRNKDTDEFFTWAPVSRVRNLWIRSENGTNEVLAVGDTNGNGSEEVIFKNGSQQSIDIKYMVGVRWYTVSVGQFDFDSWKLLGNGDFDGDGKIDLVFLNKSNSRWLRYVYSNGSRDAKIEDSLVSESIFTSSFSSLFASSGSRFKGISDYDGDGKSEILLENSQSDTAYAISPERVIEIE